MPPANTTNGTQIAAKAQPTTLTSTTSTSTTSKQTDGANDDDDDDNGDNDKRTRRQLVQLERRHFVPAEPIELTCALLLTDELDLQYTQLEWWRLDSSLWSSSTDQSLAASGQLIWNSNVDRDKSNGNWKHEAGARVVDNHRVGVARDEFGQTSMMMMKRNKNKKKEEKFARSMTSTTKQQHSIVDDRDHSLSNYAIVDYVTRSNYSDTSDQLAAALGQSKGKSVSDTRLIRVVHLIIMDQAWSAADGKQDDDDDNDDDESRIKVMRSRRQIKGANSEGGADGNDDNEKQQQQPMVFLCRVTNQAGEQLDIVHPIELGAESEQAKSEQRKRQWLRRQTTKHELSSMGKLDKLGALLMDQLASSSSSTNNNNNLERAKLAIIRLQQQQQQSASDAEGERVFIPLHFVNQQQQRALGENSAQQQIAVSLARSLNIAQQQQQQQASGDLSRQRPATRQTNGTLGVFTASPSTSSTAAAAGVGFGTKSVEQVASASVGAAATNSESQLATSKLSSLNSLALNLVARYTSNRDWLVRAQDFSSSQLEDYGARDAGKFDQDESSSSRQQQQHANAWARNKSGQVQSMLMQQQQQQYNNNNNLLARLAFAWRNFYNHHLDRWFQLALTEAPLVLALSAGLLAGCLLTMLLVLRLQWFGQQTDGGRRTTCVARYTWRKSSKRRVVKGEAKSMAKRSDKVGPSSDETQDEATNEQQQQHEEKLFCCPVSSSLEELGVVETRAPSGGASFKDKELLVVHVLATNNSEQQELVAGGESTSSPSLFAATDLSSTSAADQQQQQLVELLNSHNEQQLGELDARALLAVSTSSQQHNYHQLNGDELILMAPSELQDNNQQTAVAYYDVLSAIKQTAQNEVTLLEPGDFCAHAQLASLMQCYQPTTKQQVASSSSLSSSCSPYEMMQQDNNNKKRQISNKNNSSTHQNDELTTFVPVITHKIKNSLPYSSAANKLKAVKFVGSQHKRTADEKKLDYAGRSVGGDDDGEEEETVRRKRLGRVRYKPEVYCDNNNEQESGSSSICDQIESVSKQMHKQQQHQQLMLLAPAKSSLSRKKQQRVLSPNNNQNYHHHHQHQQQQQLYSSSSAAHSSSSTATLTEFSTTSNNNNNNFNNSNQNVFHLNEALHLLHSSVKDCLQQQTRDHKQTWSNQESSYRL